MFVVSVKLQLKLQRDIQEVLLFKLGVEGEILDQPQIAMSFLKLMKRLQIIKFKTN